MKVGIIGCGNLGLSLLKGLHESDMPLELMASKRTLPEEGSSIYSLGEVTTDNAHLIKECEILILALKPYNILPFLNEYKSLIQKDKHTIVSVATGIRITEIQDIVGPNVGTYRAMPNTAATVKESMTAVSGSTDDLNRRELIHSLFNAIGDTVEINESLMESATILGACGVAYVLRFMRAMIQGGIEVGFDASTASKIVSQTMKGASELIIQQGTHPEAEIDKVTTPKGCTIVGLNEMEHAGFSSSLIKGIVSSYNKITRD